MTFYAVIIHFAIIWEGVRRGRDNYLKSGVALKTDSDSSPYEADFRPERCIVSIPRL